MFSTGDFEVSTGGGLISVGLGMMDGGGGREFRKQYQKVPKEHRECPRTAILRPSTWTSSIAEVPRIDTKCATYFDCCKDCSG